ncbi:MAG: bifunctional pyr operon transcriptional regulator/uracil phosphoribosyltransferase PyrR [Flavobacteriales bacterium]
MSARKIIGSKQFDIIIKRLAFQLIENHTPFTDTVLIGLQPRGIFLMNRLLNELKKLQPTHEIEHGALDITFFRDDFRLKTLVPQSTKIDFVVDNKKVVLVDDVLYTGRSIRSALDAIQSFGRASKIELLVLVDRRLSREVPVKPDYTGIKVDAVSAERVHVNYIETTGVDEIILLPEEQC